MIVANKISGIYLIRNKNNGRMYVGSAINIKARWGYHKNNLNKKTHENLKLQNSWHKHGEAAFDFSIIETVENIKNLIEREQLWINTLLSDWGVAYNICRTAGSSLGRKHTEAAKQKMIGRICSPKERERRRIFAMGKKFSKETKEKISAANKGRMYPPEFGRKISARLTGRPASQESKDKMSKARKGKKLTGEHKRKISEIITARNISRTGIKLSKETRLKMSLAAKGRIFSEEHKIKMTESLIKRWERHRFGLEKFRNDIKN